jgi:hypothetical protein
MPSKPAVFTSSRPRSNPNSFGIMLSPMDFFMAHPNLRDAIPPGDLARRCVRMRARAPAAAPSDTAPGGAPCCRLRVQKRSSHLRCHRGRFRAQPGVLSAARISPLASQLGGARPCPIGIGRRHPRPPRTRNRPSGHESARFIVECGGDRDAKLPLYAGSHRRSCGAGTDSDPH